MEIADDGMLKGPVDTIKEYELLIIYTFGYMINIITDIYKVEMSKLK